MAAPRQFVMLRREDKFGGVPASAPTIGTDAIYLRLDQDDSFGVQEQIATVEINYGGGYSVPVRLCGEQVNVAGSINIPLYYPHAGLLFGWATTPINSARTAPWITTDTDSVMPPGDLATVSLYQAVQMEDGSWERKVFRGCKVQSWRIQATSEEQVVRFQAEIVGQKFQANPFEEGADPNATEFPDPTEADMQICPVLFTHLTGGLTVGSARKLFGTLNIDCQNVLSIKKFESRWNELIRFVGRRTTMDANLRLVADPDDRTAYHNLTPQDVNIVFDNGEDEIEIEFHGANFFNPHQYLLPNAEEYERSVTLLNCYDLEEQQDFEVTVTLDEGE